MKTKYEEMVYQEMRTWQKLVQGKPSFTNRFTAFTQQRWNSLIPEKIHKGITVIIEKMVKGVLFGAKHTTFKPKRERTFMETEARADQLIARYRNTASVEGAVAGSGGFVFGLAEIPVLIGIKLKLLFDLASCYGFDVKDYKERLYILHIFQLTFSSKQGRRKVYEVIADWENYSRSLPDDSEAFDWRKFQQEYRDYIDLAKLAQMIPYLGAIVGYVVNKRLVGKLGLYAKNCYRMRHFSE